ncbi:iron ABC transporter permease [bacterium]|nr:iron ABC transporter permease [bacterium]
MALVGVVLVSLCVGQYSLPLTDILGALSRAYAGTSAFPQEASDIMLWNVRIPRVEAAFLVGGALGVSGAAYQGMFRNPLVSPDILSVSSGASLGAVLGIFLGWSIGACQLLAFLGGLASVAVVYAVGRSFSNRDPVLSLVLAGIAVGALTGAIISLLKALADPYSQLPTITFWTMGGLSSVTSKDVAATAPAMICGLIPLALMRWRINLLCLDDEEAQSLGENVAFLRMILVISATLSCAAAVSLSGTIGWVGLVVPHLSRLLVGPNFVRLLPASFMLGAGFLTLTDTLARTLFPIEMPLGVLTSLVGAPFFLFLLARPEREA